MTGAKALDALRDRVRFGMDQLAQKIDHLSRGAIRPDHITYSGLLMHLPIALLIALGSFYWAAVLLVLFGLFDALDGALARTQKTDSAAGMLLDASTDRIKEVLLYIGAAYYLASIGIIIGSVWAVAACGASICVSYVKAKGETAVKDSNLSPSEINRLFADGIMRFEIRMTILIVGLVTNFLLVALIVIAIFSTITAFNRLLRIQHNLKQ